MKLFKISRWWIIGFISFVIARLPQLTAPQLSFDEGIYLSVAHDLNQGFSLYSQAWDHKPPFLYWVFSWLLDLSGGAYWIIPMASMLLCWAMIVLIYKLTWEFFESNRLATLAAGLAYLLIILGFWELSTFNGEHLFVPLNLLGFYLMLKSLKRFSQGKSWHILMIGSGLSTFLAGITKVHAIVELIGFLIGVLAYISIRHRTELNKCIKPLLIFASVWIAGGLSLLGYLAKTNDLNWSLHSIIWYNFGYTESDPEKFAYLFGKPLGVKQEVVRGIGDLGLRILTLVSVIGLEFWYWKESKSISYKIIFASWFPFALFAVMLSGRNYSHYAIQALPVVCISLAWIIYSFLKLRIKLPAFERSIKLTMTSAVMIWLVFWQLSFSVFAFGGAQISNDSIPLETLWRKGYPKVFSGDLQAWREYLIQNNYRSQEQEIVAVIQSLTTEDQRFWAYSNNPGLNYHANRPSGYTTYVYFHLSRKELDQTLKNLNQDLPTLIMVDTSFDLPEEIQTILNESYSENQRLDKLNSDNTYVFYTLN